MVDALAFLQEIGICHRDIKPANLFLLDNGEIKIIDFGESKEYLLDDENNPATMATIRGTPQYLSPILWKAHVLNPGTKQVEHNIYKSDVFSCGLVLYQLCALKDVNGFNQKTQIDGEKLIKEGLNYLGKRYSSKITEPLKKMLIFEEEKRPTFLELSKFIFGEKYNPKTSKLENQSQSKNSSSSKKNEKSDNEKKNMFKQYVERQKLKFNMNKISYWFEYGGNLIAKYYVGKEDSKWKLIGKSTNNEFPSHYIMIYIDEEIGYFLLGGIDANNCFQFKGGEIRKKSSMKVERSFMSCLNINNIILAIGGYEYNEKSQLQSIELYDIEKDKWSDNYFEDLKVARSQASSLLYNSTTIFIFGGYNKSLGTLSSIEKLSLTDKKTELLDIKIPIPLRRFATLKISETRIMIMGGITRLSKESDHVYCFDFDKKSFIKFSSLPKGGIIDHEVLLDEVGNVHLFFENNYGTSPPLHHTYNYLDFN